MAGSGPVEVRPMTAGDLADAYGLSSTAGWNQRPDDWQMLLRIAPAGSFCATEEGRVVGTAMGIDYGGFGWIAMMLVDPACRGRGLGARLLDAAMASLPPHVPIRLDATPLGRPLYQRFGFRDEATLTRFVAEPGRRSPPPAAAVSAAAPRPLTVDDLATLTRTDAEVFGGARGAVLAWQLDQAPQYAHVLPQDGDAAYCFGRPGRLFDGIGPVVADDPGQARTLVDAATAAAGDRSLVIDAFDAQAAFTAVLGQRGFTAQRPLFRMCRTAGGESRGGSARRHGKGPTEFAILGPEFG